VNLPRIKLSEFEKIYEIPEDGFIPILIDGKNFTINVNSLISGNTQSPVDLSNYLRLSGGSINGNLLISGSLSANEYLGIVGSDDTLVSTKVRASSANWDSTHTIVSSNSATWGSGSDDLHASTKVRASSANWDSSYTTVQANSAGWTPGAIVMQFGDPNVIERITVTGVTTPAGLMPVTLPRVADFEGQPTWELTGGIFEYRLLYDGSDFEFRIIEDDTLQALFRVSSLTSNPVGVVDWDAEVGAGEIEVFQDNAGPVPASYIGQQLYVESTEKWYRATAIGEATVWEEDGSTHTHTEYATIEYVNSTLGDIEAALAEINGEP